MEKPNPDVAKSGRSAHEVGAQHHQRRDYARYHAYLLRLWQESSGSPWRFLLESTSTGERRSFSSLEELFMYLDRLTMAEGGETTPRAKDGPSQEP